MRLRKATIGSLKVGALVIVALGIVVLAITKPLHISSYGSGFGRIFDIRARYKVTKQSVEILVIYGKMIHWEKAVDQYPLDNVRFGLAKGTKHSWYISEKGDKTQFVVETMPGDIIRFYLRRFSIPIDDSVELSSRWIVLEAEGFGTDSSGNANKPGWWYAHSSKNIFRSITSPKLTNEKREP